MLKKKGSTGVKKSYNHPFLIGKSTTLKIRQYSQDLIKVSQISQISREPGRKRM